VGAVPRHGRGAKGRQRLRESIGALDLVLTGADLAGIEAAIPADRVAGSRYDASQMAVPDSERPRPAS